MDIVGALLNMIPGLLMFLLGSLIPFADILTPLVRNGNHILILTPLGASLIYGIPCLLFLYLARRNPAP